MIQPTFLSISLLVDFPGSLSLAVYVSVSLTVRFGSRRSACMT